MRVRLVVFWLFGSVAPASAGRLGEVVKGLNDAADRDNGSGGEVRDHRDDSSSSGGSSYDSGGAVVSTCCYAPDGGYSEAAYHSAYNPHGPGNMTVGLDLDGGLQAVAGSGAALSGGVRVRFGGFGIAADIASYVEAAEDGGSATRLNVWNAGLQLRILDVGATKAWVEVAISGLNSDGLSMTGLSAAGILEHHLTRSIALHASARAASLDHSVEVTSLELGARFGFVSVGYRTVDFSVGPPLHGPVLGLAFTI